MSTRVSGFDDDIISGGVLILDTPVVYMPQKLQDVCQSIQRHVGCNEFSILVKGDWKEENGTSGFVIDSEPIYIPKQDVTAGSIHYMEPLAIPRRDGFNTIIHSHPGSGLHAGFSGTDASYINAFMPCSVLFAGNGFRTATLIFEIKDGYARYPAETRIYTESNAVQLSESIIKEIDEKITRWVATSWFGKTRFGGVSAEDEDYPGM